VQADLENEVAPLLCAARAGVRERGRTDVQTPANSRSDPAGLRLAPRTQRRKRESKNGGQPDRCGKEPCEN
jgi:hypothetical protein